MVHDNYGPDTSHEERGRRHMQIMYTAQMRERQIFMQELRQLRLKKSRRLFRNIKRAIGPPWYQTLSVPQQEALDALEFCIYQDLLEGRPVRTAKIMRDLGMNPRPNNIDLMNCVYLGRDDPKVMLAQLFAMTYGHDIDGKQISYCINARLLLSGILYLGLDSLISALKEIFRPDQAEKPVKPKPKRKQITQLQSPYLEKMNTVLYTPPQKKREKPPPLPNLDVLNEPYEEDPPLPKPAPLPPPPPPPKKRLPRSYCDKLAGVMTIEPHASGTTLTMKTVTRTSQRKIRGTGLCLTEVKKTYGISLTNTKKSKRRRKPIAPSTGICNSQYMINGVYQIHGKAVFVLGSVSILPSKGDLIHGGYRYLGGEYINIHCGFRAMAPPPKPDPCDCVIQWQEAVFKFVKEKKCICHHHYDYGNEGHFPPEELPFFEKPTKHTPSKFNYETIYDLDAKQLQVKREFKKIWDTDSVLRVDDGTVKDKDKKKRKKRSGPCLGEDPGPEEYLKCALRLQRGVNVAARLPDIHLVPELREWMRRRIHGPFNRHEKAEMQRKSTMYWQMFQLMASRGYGHVPVSTNLESGHTTWARKQKLKETFRKFTGQYKLALFRSLANLNNLMWPSMFHAEFPDKKFREIYFSYLFARVDDLMLMHPYSSRESTERQMVLSRKRYCCIPAGIEPV